MWRDFDRLVFRLGEGYGETAYQIAISSGNPSCEAGGFKFTLERGLKGELLKSIIEGTPPEKQRPEQDWLVAALDDRALPGHLVIRTRRAGERAHVLGQRRTKKLKNLMIDHRIPSSRRASWPIVTTPDGFYLWSPGLPPALDFSARDETHGLAILRASPI